MTLKEKIAEVFKKHSIDPKSLFSEEVKAMAEARLDNGTAVMTDADEWAVGVAIFIEEEGERIALPDGEYTLEDGTAVTVENGTVAAWETAAEKDKEEMESEALTEEKVSALIDSKLAPFAEIMNQMVEEFSNKEKEAKEELKKVEENAKAELAAKDKEIEDLKSKPAEKSLLKKVQKVQLEKEWKDMTPEERRRKLISK